MVAQPTRLEKLERLHQEQQAYEGMREELEARHRGSFVVVHAGELVGVYPDILKAMDAARAFFGDGGGCLLRQVGWDGIGAPPLGFPPRQVAVFGRME